MLMIATCGVGVTSKAAGVSTSLAAMFDVVGRAVAVVVSCQRPLDD